MDYIRTTLRHKEDVIDCRNVIRGARALERTFVQAICQRNILATQNLWLRFLVCSTCTFVQRPEPTKHTEEGGLARRIGAGNHQ